MTEADRRRLIASLRLLSSDQPGERDAAALAVTRLVGRLGMTWDALIVPHDPLAWARTRPDPEVSPATPQARAADLLTRHDALADASPLGLADLSFLRTIATWRGGISPKQWKWLTDITHRIALAETVPSYA